MARLRSTKPSQQTLTTAQRLGSLIKSARDIMRKDKGLNGDLDRLPNGQGPTSPVLYVVSSPNRQLIEAFSFAFFDLGPFRTIFAK